ncbi:MAG TPA: TIGR03089 family protein [Nocardioides sp.]|nr:TIGR03089 family protein [Nocardioides sp.]
MTTFASVLEGLLRGDASRPLITFYDHASGERTELSVTTYANWVAKTAGLLADELDLVRGQVIRIDLPSHWLVPVFLGAAWTVGLAVTHDDAADAYVCGPGSLDRWAGQDAVVLASALQPLGTRFADPLPMGVHDYGVEVWSQPDAWVAFDPPGPHDLAVGDTTHAELWAAAAAGDVLADGGRVLTEENPASPSGLPSFTEPLVRGGSLVLVAHADPARLDATYAAERATIRFPPA